MDGEVCAGGDPRWLPSSASPTSGSRSFRFTPAQAGAPRGRAEHCLAGQTTAALGRHYVGMHVVTVAERAAEAAVRRPGPGRRGWRSCLAKCLDAIGRSGCVGTATEGHCGHGPESRHTAAVRCLPGHGPLLGLRRYGLHRHPRWLAYPPHLPRSHSVRSLPPDTCAAHVDDGHLYGQSAPSLLTWRQALAMTGTRSRSAQD